MLWFFQSIGLSCIITLGWIMMFTVPKRYTLHCLSMTAFGYGLKSILMQFDVNLIFATFLGGMAASFLGVYYSKRFILPPKALIMPSVICLMPGLVSYKAMVSMVQIGYFGFSNELFTQMMTHSFKAIFITSSLVLGLSIPSIIFYRKKPIV